MEYVPIHRVDVIFTRNMPVNELEISQMIKNLEGIATNETLLSQLSFVGDAREEAMLVAAPLSSSMPDRKSTRLNSSHPTTSRMPSSA